MEDKIQDAEVGEVKSAEQIDQEERVAKFQEGYKKLVEEFQIDFTATIQPVMKIVDLKAKPE